MATLPLTICLKSVYNDKYLRYVNEDNEVHGLLHFGATTSYATDPYTHFDVEYSQSYPDLVHIKSRCNNKYWVRWSRDHYWISASSDSINEDQNNWACTLFRPIIEGTDVRLVHVQLGHYACLWRAEAPFNSCLYAGYNTRDKDRCEVFYVAQHYSLNFRFPKNVAFKGENGKYLGPFTGYIGGPYLEFSYDDPKNPKVAHQLLEAPDDLVCIKSQYFNKFWRIDIDNENNSGWVMADVAFDPHCSNNSAAMFKPKVLGNKLVALANSDETLFCKRFTEYAYENCLKAATESIDMYTQLEIVDLDDV